MSGYERYCDHHFVRDDVNCEICLRCHERREIQL